MTAARRSRLGGIAAIAGGAVAIAAGAFFIGHAAGSSGNTSVQPISTANAVNAADAASNGSTSSAQCTLGNVAAGTLKSVKGTTLTVTDRSGKDVTVTTSSSTKITKVVNGSLSDITPGVVIGVHGTASGQSGINADDIAVIPAQKAPNLGKLPQGAGRFGQRLGLAFGTVKSVSGNTVVVQEADGTTITVTTSSSTKIQKTVNAQPKDLTVGQPIVATGTANANGSIAASNVVQGSVDLGFKGFGLGGLRPGDLGHFRAPFAGGEAPASPSTTAPAAG
ncbi:MAG TPA: DUF5666 domain-containing protein [Acidimicrobiales bacterium]|nr:DUF5666 domain-containing protein [Acidimicrobiales bacterium]